MTVAEPRFLLHDHAMNPASGFAGRVEGALADLHLRGALERATSQFGTRRTLALATLEDSDAIRDAARAARMDAIAHLGEYLERFEAKLLANGAHVHWAETPDAANTISRHREAEGRQGRCESKCGVPKRAP